MTEISEGTGKRDRHENLVMIVCFNSSVIHIKRGHGFDLTYFRALPSRIKRVNLEGPKESKNILACQLISHFLITDLGK